MFLENDCFFKKFPRNCVLFLNILKKHPINLNSAHLFLLFPPCKPLGTSTEKSRANFFLMEENEQAEPCYLQKFHIKELHTQMIKMV